MHTLPIEIIYRILDHLSDENIVLSIRNVCQRLDAIIDTSHRYKVIYLECRSH